MNKRLIAVSAALAVLSATASLPARAQTDDLTFTIETTEQERAIERFATRMPRTPHN